MNEKLQSLSRALPPRQDCTVQLMSSATRANSVGHPCDPSEPLPHEGVPVLGSFLRAELWRVLVTPECARALRHWLVLSFLMQGVSMDTVLSRKLITTDASMIGWAGVYEGQSVRCGWGVNKFSGALSGVSLPETLSPFLESHHILVRTENTMTVSYINWQGGLCSRRLYMLACRLILWSCGSLLSLRATHIPGHLNLGADMLSKSTPVYGEWALHPAVVEGLGLLRTSLSGSVR